MLKLSACLVLSATGNAMVSWCSSLLGERFGHRLRGWLMGTLMARDQAFFDAASKGDLLSRLTLDVTVLQNTLAGAAWGRGACLAQPPEPTPTASLVAYVRSHTHIHHAPATCRLHRPARLPVNV